MVRLWNRRREPGAAGIELCSMRDQNAVTTAALSADGAGGARVLSVSADRIARVWDAATGVEVARLTMTTGSDRRPSAPTECASHPRVAMLRSSGAPSRQRRRADARPAPAEPACTPRKPRARMAPGATLDKGRGPERRSTVVITT
jgi:hypothetical protein